MKTRIYINNFISTTGIKPRLHEQFLRDNFCADGMANIYQQFKV